MLSPEEEKARFDGVMSRLNCVRSQLKLPSEDSTIVVDARDLESNCVRYQDQISHLLELPSTPEINAELGRLLIALQVSIQEIEACCSGLKGPLDRLITAVYEHLPEDPEYADDAS